MVRADVASTLPEVFARHPALRERSRKWSPLSDPVSTSPLIFRQPPARAGRHADGGRRCGLRGSVRGRWDFACPARRRVGGALPRVFLFRRSFPAPRRRARYGRAYEQSLLPVFRASSTIRRMLVLPGSIRKPLLFILERTPAMTELSGAQDPLRRCGREQLCAQPVAASAGVGTSSHAEGETPSGQPARLPADRRDTALQARYGQSRAAVPTWFAASGRPGLRERCRGRGRILWKRNRGRDFRCCGC